MVQSLWILLAFHYLLQENYHLLLKGKHHCNHKVVCIIDNFIFCIIISIWLIICKGPVSVTNLESLNSFNIFYVPLLILFVTFMNLKKKIKIVFRCLSAMKIVAPSSPNFLLKLIYWGILESVSLGKSKRMSL